MPSDSIVDVAVRLAQVEDADAVAQLTKQLGYEVAASDVAAKLSRILPRTDQRFFVAECDGHPIAWLHVASAESVEADPFVVVAGLVVDSGYRRKGVGRMLMEEAETWSRKQECSIVRLWSSAVRTESHRFYEGLGYTNVKTQYSFAKWLETGGRSDLTRLIPKVDR